MKVKYKNCEIDVHRGDSITGENLLFFSVFNLEDGFEVTSGYSEGEDTIKSYIEDLKSTVDEYREHPEYYDDDYEFPQNDSSIEI